MYPDPGFAFYIKLRKMDNEKESNLPYKPRPVYRRTGNSIYFFAFVGSFIYYVGHATTFWIGVAGFFKALLWPGFLVYYLLEFMKV